MFWISARKIFLFEPGGVVFAGFPDTQEVSAPEGLQLFCGPASLEKLHGEILHLGGVVKADYSPAAVEVGSKADVAVAYKFLDMVYVICQNGNGGYGADFVIGEVPGLGRFEGLAGGMGSQYRGLYDLEHVHQGFGGDVRDVHHYAQLLHPLHNLVAERAQAVAGVGIPVICVDVS